MAEDTNEVKQPQQEAAVSEKRRVVRIEIVDNQSTKVWLDDGSELVGLTRARAEALAGGFANYQLDGFIMPTGPVP